MKILVFSFAALWICSHGFPGQTDLDGLHSEPAPVPAATLDNNPERDAKYWYNKATKELQRKKKIVSDKKAKNIILFMGDGLSIPTLTAARIFLAEKKNQSMSESGAMSFEDFLYSGLARTYCVDATVADSACSATAFLGGSKGNIGTIGVSGRVLKRDIKASLVKENRVDSIALLAQRAGKATGFVTNTRVTHASPAGTFAYTASRNWECDADMENDKINSTAYDDIAEQLILREPGINFNVILGGGRKNFIPKTETDPEGKLKGLRLDLNLIEKWKADKKAKGVKNYKYVWNRKDLMALTETQSYLLGLFAYNHMDNKVDKNPNQPTLEEMTEQALKVLKKQGGDKGYFLFVEGGRIDIAHHYNQAQISLDETFELSKAVAKAVSMTSEEDTLIVVTSDHSHTLNINGYPSRSESIFGFAGVAADKWVYTTMSYSNGPGGLHGRKDLSKEPTKKVDYVFPAGTPLHAETHGGEDVAVFARGPNAQLLSGSYEQNFIPHAMALAANLRTFQDYESV